MKMHEERKHRAIDPFELKVFQEEQSKNLAELEQAIRLTKEKVDLETLSMAPSNAYRGHMQKKKPQKKKVVDMLPHHIS